MNDEAINPYEFNASQNGGALTKLSELGQTDIEFMESYLQLLAERENTMNAEQWYEKMSGSQYQRAVDDLRKAGLNPALALTALSPAGSGSVSSAGTWSNSPVSNMISRENVAVSRQNADISKQQNAIKIAGLVTTTVIAMLAMLL